MRVGSLCSGYGGLDLAVGDAPVWVAENDKHASKVLARRFPSAPNLGDLTSIDWATVPPVDAITAGYPCQPFSVAGKQKGTDDPRHIWPHIARAVRVLRPSFIFLENVPGHRRRGFGAVLGDLAALGFDADWVSVRACDVGAPHRRERVFITATDPNVSRREESESAARRDVSSRRTHADTAGNGRDEGRTESAREQGRPNASERGGPAIADPRSERLGQHARRASSEEAGALPSDEPRRDRDGQTATDWGPYRPAVEAWERTLGRVAPAPTTLGIKGQPVLAPVFVEWLMGLPAGWVTDVDGIPRTQQLKILGNGVVPQQAAQALAFLDVTRRVAVAHA